MKIYHLLSLVLAGSVLISSSCTTNNKSSISDISSDSRIQSQCSQEQQHSIVTVGNSRFEYLEGTQMYFSGRWFDKVIEGVNCKVSTNNGAEIYFIVSGTESVTILCPNNGNVENCTPIFAYAIDGATHAPVRVTVVDDKLEIPLPDTGNHMVRLITESTNAGGDKWMTGRGYAVSGIDAHGGNVTGIKPNAKTIAFYGDSITEGTFVRGLNWNNDSSGTYTYAWQTARKLGVTPYMCGYGSSGVMQDGFFKDALTASDYMTNGVYDPGPENPAVIVINHGANDQKYADIDVLARYKAFIEHLHEKHPNAQIVCLEPFGHFKASVIEQASSCYDFCYFVSTKGWQLSFTDGLHPNVIGAERAGQLIADALIDIFGSDFFEE